MICQSGRKRKWKVLNQKISIYEPTQRDNDKAGSQECSRKIPSQVIEQVGSWINSEGFFFVELLCKLSQRWSMKTHTYIFAL